MAIWHLKQIGKVKKLNKWMPHELTRNLKQKNCHLETSSSLILCNKKPFLDQIMACKKSEFQKITSDDQLSGWTKKKPQSTSQSQRCTEKRSWSLFGGLLLE